MFATLTLALASCSTRRPVPRPTAPVPTPVPAPPARAATPAQFVATAASIDLFVVRGCELALARSSNGHIRALAAVLADEHRGLGAQLSLAGRWLDTLPAARLAPREIRRLAALDGPGQFDARFVSQMSAAHRQSLALHASFAARGSSPTLRPVAINGATVERRHLALIEAM